MAKLSLRSILNSGPAWIIYYFLANLSLTIHNKWVLNRLMFSFPWLLSALQIFSSGIGATILLWINNHTLQKLEFTENMSLIGFSVLYTINIALSNVSMNYVSLAFHQLVRSSTPVFTVLLDGIFWKKYHTLFTYLSLIPVVVGIMMASGTRGDGPRNKRIECVGVSLTVLGVLLSSLKGIVTNILMVGRLKLHPLELMYRMSFLASFQCLIYSLLLGEYQEAVAFVSNLSSPSNNAQQILFCGLLVNVLCAFILSYISLTANKKTSALSMTVAGNVKQALSICLAVWIFHTNVSVIHASGIFITLMGGVIYSPSSISYQQKQAVLNQSKPRMDEFDAPPVPTATNISTSIATTGSSQGNTSAKVTSPIKSPSAKTDVYCCAIDRLLHQRKESENGANERCPSGPYLIISITDAAKASDSGGSGSYYSYTISFNSFTVKRRYSDFESLRNALVQVHPSVVMPPIPEKHSLASYAKPSKSKDDALLAEKRKRMLQSFLNRLAEHPLLSSHHLFHRFLEEDRIWSDILAAEHIKKEKSAFNSGKEKIPDPRFTELENDNSYYGHSLSSLEKTHKRLCRKVQELSADISDLGASFNGFSLEESLISSQLEKVGEAIDAMQTSTTALSSYYEEIFLEVLQEFSLFSNSVKQVLKYRKHKQLELEEITDQLINKQNQLVQLETGSPATTRRNQNVVSNLTNSISTMLDSSPEMTRRHGIAKTRDIITQLEAQKHKSQEDLVKLADEVIEEIRFFQNTRQRDMKYILGQFVKEQVNYHNKNIETWEASLEFVEKSIE